MEHSETGAAGLLPDSSPLQLKDGVTVDVRVAAVDDPLARRAQEAYSAELFERFGFAPGAPDAPEEGAFFFIVLNGEEPIGYGGIRPVPSRLAAAEVKRMWVHADWRGSGLGSALLRRLEDTAAAQGYKEIVLDTNGSLEEAIRLYDRAGYRRIRRYNDNPDAEMFFAKDLLFQEDG